MCDTIKKFFAGLGGYFSTPTFSKGVPSYAASAAAAMSISLPDLVTIITCVYTVVLLIGALPGLWKTWDFFRNRHNRITNEGKKDD